VQVTFRTKRLQECYAAAKKAQREWDEKVARRYIERVNILKHAKSVDDLYKTPGLRFHPMKGDKEGRYSITLIDRWRMEVSFRDKALTIVRVEEVSQHYGD
jgi:proteic killer suppression protein